MRLFWTNPIIFKPTLTVTAKLHRRTCSASLKNIWQTNGLWWRLFRARTARNRLRQANLIVRHRNPLRTKWKRKWNRTKWRRTIRFINNPHPKPIRNSLCRASKKLNYRTVWKFGWSNKMNCRLFRWIWFSKPAQPTTRKIWADSAISPPDYLMKEQKNARLRKSPTKSNPSAHNFLPAETMTLQPSEWQPWPKILTKHWIFIRT